MQFNSIIFFIFLFTVIILINSLRQKQYQHGILLVASYFFYWSTSNYFVILLVFITIISFEAGNAIFNATVQKERKILLVISVISLLIPLGFFKYFNFGIETFDQIAHFFGLPFPIKLLNIVLPVGISFFTFSAISYIADLYQGVLVPEEKLYRYALFISYFPHLLSGPIVRAGQFLPQLKNSISIAPESLKLGITLMVWGFVKKFIIADNCAPIINIIFADPLSFNSFYIIVGTLLFGIQIYCDFSGYIDIALGAAEVIGLHLPQNFIRPYLSPNPTEFWRRWNITLSSFIRDYLYIPMGGNRKGKRRTYFNLIASMVLCGLWHGAAWNFVIWGGYHGVLLITHKILREKCNPIVKLFHSGTKFIGIFFAILITQYFIFLGWIMFRVGNTSDMLYCLKKFIFIDIHSFCYQNVGHPLFDELIKLLFNIPLNFKLIIFGICLLLILIILLSEKIMHHISQILSADWMQYISSMRLPYWILFLSTMMLFLLCFTPSANPDFIYFQF